MVLQVESPVSQPLRCWLGESRVGGVFFLVCIIKIVQGN